MKTFIVIVSILLFTEIHQSVAGEGTANNTEDEVNESSTKPKLSEENQKSLKAKIDEIKVTAINRRKTAIHEARLAYQEAQQKAAQLIDETNPKYDKNHDIAYKKYKQAGLIAYIIRSNRLKQLADIMRRIDDEYKQKEEDAERKCGAVQRVAEEEFIKAYVEIENKKRDAENKYKDALEKGRNARENAVQVAEERKGLAEKDFREAAKQYKKMPLEEWAKVKAEYIKEMEAYDEALQLADTEWQEVLDEAGVGKQYENALDKVFAEFKEKQDLATSTTSKLQSECDADLQKAKEQRENEKRQLEDDKEKARAAYRQASSKAEEEYEEAIENTERRRKKNKALADIEVKTYQTEYDEAISKADTEFQKAMEEADKMMAGIDKTVVNGRQRKIQPPRRTFNANTRRRTYNP